jgi:methylglutaconyl-CoA hydratase
MLAVEVHGAVGYLTIDRPDVRNALGPEVVAALAAGLDRIESDAAVRAVVLTGAGKVFSAGADLSSMRRQGAADAEDNRRNALEMGSLFHRIYDFPKPVVARVPGPAIGGGVGLMTACDVIVAVESAFFSFSEVRLGIVPALISPFCIRRLGVAKARKLFLTGEKITAPVARELGLVDEVTAEADLDDGVNRVLDALLQGAPGALAAAKNLVNEVAHLSPTAALPFTADLLARLRASEEAREGMTAFLEKRPPSWRATRD